MLDVINSKMMAHLMTPAVSVTLILAHVSDPVTPSHSRFSCPLLAVCVELADPRIKTQHSVKTHCEETPFQSAWTTIMMIVRLQQPRMARTVLRPDQKKRREKWKKWIALGFKRLDEWFFVLFSSPLPPPHPLTLLSFFLSFFLNNHLRYPTVRWMASVRTCVCFLLTSSLCR